MVLVRNSPHSKVHSLTSPSSKICKKQTISLSNQLKRQKSCRLQENINCCLIYGPRNAWSFRHICYTLQRETARTHDPHPGGSIHYKILKEKTEKRVKERKKDNVCQKNLSNLILSMNVSLDKFRVVFCVRFSILHMFNNINVSNSKSLVPNA